MQMEIGFLAGLAVAILAYTGTFIRVGIAQRLDLVDWFVLAFGTLNGLGFSFVVWATGEGLNVGFWSSWIEAYTSYYAYYGALGWILLFSVWSGAFIANSLRVGRHYSPNNEEVLSSPSLLERVAALGWILLAAAAIIYWFYARAYGGFRGLLLVGRFIRSGLFDLIPENPWSFLRPFGGVALFSSFLFWGLLFGKTRQVRRCPWLLGFVLSLGFSIYVLFSWLGRVGMAVYILVFPLSLFLSKYGLSPHSLTRVALVMVIGLIFLSFSDAILGTGKGDDNLIRFFAKELSFPFVSFFAQIHHPKLRYMRDLFASPLYLLPQRVWSGWLGLETASMLNTELIKRARKGEAGVTGEVPVDILTFSFMQMDVLGIVIIGFIWGWFLFWLDGGILRFPVKEVVPVIYSDIMIRASVLTALYGDPQEFIMRNFHMIVGLTALLIILKLPGRGKVGRRDAAR